jgi:hypothetical protein
MILLSIPTAWLVVLAATIGACRVAARADAEEGKLCHEARGRSSVRRGALSPTVSAVRSARNYQVAEVRAGTGPRLGCQAKSRPRLP